MNVATNPGIPSFGVFGVTARIPKSSWGGVFKLGGGIFGECLLKVQITLQSGRPGGARQKPTG